MTFREKRAWIELMTTLVVFGAYFALFGRAWMTGQGTSFGLLVPVAATVGLLAVLQVGLLIAAAVYAPGDAAAPFDERDQLISLLSTRAGFYALQAGAFLALTALALGAPAAIVVNVLLGVMVLGEVARSAGQVLGYRWGAA